MSQTKPVADYVQAAAELQNLSLDGERLASVTRNFELLAEMADKVLAVELPDSVEPAPVYWP